MVDGGRRRGVRVELGPTAPGAMLVVIQQQVSLRQSGLPQVLPANDGQRRQGGQVELPDTGTLTAENGEPPNRQQDMVVLPQPLAQAFHSVKCQ